MGSPVGTVKTRVAAALTKLRGALFEEGRGDSRITDKALLLAVVLFNGIDMV